MDQGLVTPLVHLYRGELGRMTAYRQRLDATTHLSVVTAAALLTFVLGRPEVAPNLIGLGLIFEAGFTALEAHRYRRLALVKERVRRMETGFFVELLGGTVEPWQEALRSSLALPRPPVSMFRALGNRLRMVHLWIMLTYGTGWGIGVARSPLGWQAAEVGPLSGQGVAGLWSAVILLLIFWASLGRGDLDA